MGSVTTVASEGAVARRWWWKLHELGWTLGAPREFSYRKGYGLFNQHKELKHLGVVSWKAIGVVGLAEISGSDHLDFKSCAVIGIV